MWALVDLRGFVKIMVHMENIVGFQYNLEIEEFL